MKPLRAAPILLLLALFALPVGLMGMIANMNIIFGQNVPVLTQLQTGSTSGTPVPPPATSTSKGTPAYFAFTFLAVLLAILAFGYRGRLISRLKQLPILLGMTLLSSITYVLVTSVRLPKVSVTLPSVPAVILGAMAELAAMLLLGLYLIKRYRITLSSQPSQQGLEVPLPSDAEPIYGQTPGEYRQVVISAYRSFCGLLEKLGLPSPRHKTPREFARDVEESYGSLKEETETMTGLFELARYSQRDVSKEDAELSLKELQSMKAKVRGEAFRRSGDES